MNRASFDVQTILMERFPKIALMSHSWEEKPIVSEPLPQFEVGRAQAIYFYGIGKGEIYFFLSSWLKENEKRRLILLEDDPGIIASFLKGEKAAQILCDPQVHLEWISATSAFDLSQKFPFERIEVIGLASKRKWKKFRLELLRKTALSHGFKTDREHGYQPFENFLKNLHFLPSSFYANPMKQAFSNIPAVVCGAGPSLQKAIETLKKLQGKVILIAGGSTIAALSSHGITPTFGMAIDPNLEEYRRFRNSFAFEMPLLYSTRVHPDIFQTCNGPFGYMRSGIGGMLELWIEEVLGLQDPFIGEELSDEAMSVTNSCIAWAHFLGCNPIVLSGIDMAYTEGRHYAPGVVDQQPLDFKKLDLEKSAADRILNRKARDGKRIKTAVRWIMEAASISQFAKKCPHTRFINTTEGGIGLKGIEYVPLEEISACFTEQPIDSLVSSKILESKMPENTAVELKNQIKELKASLLRVIESLEVLTGQKKGSKALAELEIEEEIATLYLFYDVRKIFDIDAQFWQKWLELAEKYAKVFHSVSSYS